MLHVNDERTRVEMLGRRIQNLVHQLRAMLVHLTAQVCVQLQVVRPLVEDQGLTRVQAQHPRLADLEAA